jgi:uncharacterized alpha-E superfamily protein
MMLLSRMAESLYWAGRYLERAEATARLLKVHSELYLDLPMSAGVGWSPLLAVTGSTEEFDARYEDRDEENIVRFLSIDDENPGSVLSSVCSARAGFRVARTIVPRGAWQITNRLFLFVTERPEDAVARRTRLGWMAHVIEQLQTLAGAISSSMTHDEAYSFLEIGRRLERADMTTRVLDVQAEILMGQEGQDVHPYADVTWMSVLGSLSARQMFRRAGHGGAPGPAAIRFLLTHPQFPRSVERCLTEISRSLMELPSYEEPMAACAEVQARLEGVDLAALADAGLHECMDDLQTGFGLLHDRLAASYFRNPSVTGALAVA